jgi:hypothetical protein
VIRLQHKTTQIVTNFSFADILTNINSPRIEGNYLDGTINLNNNNISTEGYVANGTKTGIVTLTIPSQDPHTRTAAPVKINGASGTAGAVTTGRFKAQINSMDFNNTSVTRDVDAPFLIKPGYKTTLNIVQGRCGANINGTDRFFMCHNLGADYSVNPDPNDPNTDKAKLHGAKFQFGAATETISMQLDQSADRVNFTNNGDNNSDWANNPCPSGYRVPTESELSSLMGSNGVDNSYNRSTFTGVPGFQIIITMKISEHLLQNLMQNIQYHFPRQVGAKALIQ